jgi:glucosamine--fructose-6-phosphate aminotransferase (isomerizing)
MCSVVGYVGKRHSRSIVIQGLKRLEYRGYDAAGFACLDPAGERLLYVKTQGRLSNLELQLDQTLIDGFLSVGHTRWSTHGSADLQENAHPHFDCNKEIAVVHNGIIENHLKLKEQLLKMGHVFHSQTDTEVIAHLFESLLISHQTFNAAVIDLVSKLEGAYAFICLLQNQADQLLLVRNRSPLCIGIGNDEMFVASDPLAFADKTTKMVFMPDASIAIVRGDMLELYDFNGNPLPIHAQEINEDHYSAASEKSGYEHYMLKEIFDQKDAMCATINFLDSINKNIWDYIGIDVNLLQRLSHIKLIGCGTSWHAARIAQFFFEYVCRIPTRVYLASEFRYMPQFVEDNTICIAMSQSGETADTLEVLRMMNKLSVPTIALTNVASSTLMREANGFLLTQAGREIAVASTKAFSTQLTALYWFAHFIAMHKKMITPAQLGLAQEELRTCAQVLENSVENYRFSIVNTLAPLYATFTRAIFLGRHISYPLALEAALKLKQVSYIFSQSYPAGEIKHGPLALIDDQTPVFIFSHQDQLMYQKILSNAQEVKAHNGRLVVFAFEGQHEICSIAEHSFVVSRVHPLLGQLAMTGLMQFFVYAIANELGRPIDHPRNLGKSVTVA